jgi:hypothetical protein
MYRNGAHPSKNTDAAEDAFEDAGAPMISKYSPAVGTLEMKARLRHVPP